MAVCVNLLYSVSFGKGDGSDWYDWEIELDGEAEAAYLEAKKLQRSFDQYPILEEILLKASDEIAEAEEMAMIEAGDEYVEECLGLGSVDPDDINDLVEARDPHTLEFFGLEKFSDEELSEWDANDLDKQGLLPTIAEFMEGFEPESPFANGYELEVRFAEAPEVDC